MIEAREINATINVTVNVSPDGSYKDYNFIWDGPEDGILGISGELMMDADRNLLIRSDEPKPGDVITFGIFDLVILEHQLLPVEIYYCKRKEYVLEKTQ